MTPSTDTKIDHVTKTVYIEAYLDPKEIDTLFGDIDLYNTKGQDGQVHLAGLALLASEALHKPVVCEKIHSVSIYTGIKNSMYRIRFLLTCAIRDGRQWQRSYSLAVYPK